jgi:hypothetical protein
MKRSRMTTMVRVLACASTFFQAHGVAALDGDIVFAAKAFFDNGDVSVEISGTLTGKDVPYKNNTVSVSCYKDRHECVTYSIEQIGPNQIGRLMGPTIYPIATWNDHQVIATEDATVVDCRKTTIVLERKSQSAVWVEEPINQARAICKDSTTKVYKWAIEDPPAWKVKR